MDARAILAAFLVLAFLFCVGFWAGYATSSERIDADNRSIIAELERRLGEAEGALDRERARNRRATELARSVASGLGEAVGIVERLEIGIGRLETLLRFLGVEGSIAPE
jgi:hypothetical protein